MNKKLSIFVASIFLALALISYSHAATEITGKVIGISDGDTITVLQNKTQYKIRLYGIDCPESHQDFGTKAKQFTSDLVYWKQVKVVQQDMDRYGRTVGGDLCLNQEIIKNGFAWVYQRYCDTPICKDWFKAGTTGQKQ
jgi:micrococcal nuclease